MKIKARHLKAAAMAAVNERRLSLDCIYVYQGKDDYTVIGTDSYTVLRINPRDVSHDELMTIKLGEGRESGPINLKRQDDDVEIDGWDDGRIVVKIYRDGKIHRIEYWESANAKEPDWDDALTFDEKPADHLALDGYLLKKLMKAMKKASYGCDKFRFRFSGGNSAVKITGLYSSDVEIEGVIMPMRWWDEEEDDE